MDGKYYIVILCFFVLGIIVFFSKIEKRKVKNRIHNSWGKFPVSRVADSQESIHAGWQATKKVTVEKSEIDDLTWNDLDLWKLFEQINATGTSLGSEYLYGLLRKNKWEEDKQKEFRGLVDYFFINEQEREKVQYRLFKIGKKKFNLVNTYLTKNKYSFLKFSWLFYSMSFLTLFFLIGIIVTQSTSFVMIFVFLICMNIIVYYLLKSKLEAELNAMNYLANLLVVSKGLGKEKFPSHKKVMELSANFKNIRYFGFVFNEKEVSDSQILFDYLCIAFMLPFVGYNLVVYQLKKYNQQALELVEMIGKIDAAIGVANYQTLLPFYTLPEFTTKPMLEATETYHPLLETPVANNVHLKSFNLVTGSNASGKSIYVKSVAINGVLAQTIGIVCGRQWKMFPGEIYSSMAIEDNLFEGDSYFVAEVKSVKRILDRIETGHFCYVFIDEILKGTNTIERIASSSEIIKWLTERDCLGYIATHDIELTYILGERCHNIHFREEIVGDRSVQFNYLLHQGPSKTKNAIRLLEVLNYPNQVVSNAKNLGNRFEKTGKWS